MKTAKNKKTSDGLKILDSITGNDPDVRIAINVQKLRHRVAEMVLAARESKNLTQTKLAQLARSKQSVISRIENAEDTGTVTMAMLSRLFSVLDLDLNLGTTPAKASAMAVS